MTDVQIFTEDDRNLMREITVTMLRVVDQECIPAVTRFLESKYVMRVLGPSRAVKYEETFERVKAAANRVRNQLAALNAADVSPVTDADYKMLQEYAGGLADASKEMDVLLNAKETT